MPALLALPAFWGAVGAGAVATGAIASAKIGSNAYNKGAQAQTQAANYAADKTSQSAAAALQFQKEQAALDAQRAEENRHANYDQWAAREGRLGTLGELIGAGSRNIPAYVPISQGGTPPPTTGTGATGTTSGLSTAQAAFDKLFPGDTLTPDMLTKNESALKALGFTLRPNAAGVVGKIQYGNGPIIDVIQGAGSGLNKKQFLIGGGATPTGTTDSYLGSASSLLSSDLSPAVQPGRWTARSMMGGSYA